MLGVFRGSRGRWIECLRRPHGLGRSNAKKVRLPEDQEERAPRDANSVKTLTLARLITISNLKPAATKTEQNMRVRIAFRLM